MIRKMNILIQGGIKRGNKEIVDTYSKKLNFWERKKSSESLVIKQVLL